MRSLAIIQILRVTLYNASVVLRLREQTNLLFFGGWPSRCVSLRRSRMDRCLLTTLTRSFVGRLGPTSVRRVERLSRIADKPGRFRSDPTHPGHAQPSPLPLDIAWPSPLRQKAIGSGVRTVFEAVGAASTQNLVH